MNMQWNNLVNCRKILVLGSPGAGKTHFSRNLATILNLPLYHLDDEYWLNNWQRPPKDKWKERLKLICEKECWVIDGNYAEYLGLRLKYSDCAILLLNPWWSCLFRVAVRGVKRWVGEEDTMPIAVRNNCASGLRIDPRFVWKVLFFRSSILPNMEKDIKEMAVNYIALIATETDNLLSLLKEKV